MAEDGSDGKATCEFIKGFLSLRRPLEALILLEGDVIEAVIRE
jgi:hypothetical protein